MLSKNYTNIFILLLYLSLLFGIYSGEDLIGGAFNDYKGHFYISEKFRSEFLNTLLSYNQLGHRHSPIFYILRSFISEIEIIQRLFFLHLYLLIPVFFYLCLKIKYKEINNNNLKLLASVLLLFPAFRSYSIWPDPHLLGILFLTISIYFFLIFKYINSSIKNTLTSSFFLALSAYASPNFGVFIIYFFYKYFKFFKFTKKIFILSIFNLLLSLPFFYYIFILKINFIFNEYGWDIGSNVFSLNNVSNKLILISSIFLFYIIPLLNIKNLYKESNSFLKFNLYKYNFFIIFFISCYLFDFSYSYSLTNSGGGIFYNISNFLFDNNYLLFLISFLAACLLFKIFKDDKKNLVLFLCLILSNPQITLWQANHSPTIFLLILLLFNIKFLNKKLDLKNLLIIFLYFMSFILANLIKNILI